MFFFSSRRRHTRCGRDWSSDVCSSDLILYFAHEDLGPFGLAVREVQDARAVRGPARIRSLHEEPVVRSVGAHDPEVRVPLVVDLVDRASRVHDLRAVGGDLRIGNLLPVQVMVDREQGIRGDFLSAGGPGHGRADNEGTAKKFVHQRAAFAPPVRLSLTTCPPFITNPTCSSTVTSCNGSPITPITSANLPGSSAPTRSRQPSRSAALTVAAWIACSDVVPHRTMCANCFAFQPCGYTPASVP